jgi:predicted pyridoxine 5'-phosphate oxidase superfamily flavin-nucleotide-binding protein
MELSHHWETIQKIFDIAYKSCSHVAIATVNEDGTPHVTPIGALFLRADQTGFYFDEYPSKMPENIKRNPRICILAVNADKIFWARSLLEGRFSAPPAVRLTGTVGELREATSQETEAWKKRTSLARGLKGYRIMWERMGHVRDIKFDSFEPVNLGKMTAGLW